MDLTTIIGLIFAFIALVGGFALEGGGPGGLIDGVAFLIVVGGTVAAVVVSFPFSELKRLPALTVFAFREPKLNTIKTIQYLVQMATIARREGILALENHLEDMDIDPVLREGMELVIDGSEPELIKEMMEIELDFFEKQNETGAKMFETAGAFSPTMGIIGTVMGLVHVLSSLSEPETLGPAIAMAFIATLYGVAAANVIYIPIANKLKYRNEQMVKAREMMMEGVLSIQAGENPNMLEKKLQAFLTPREREQLRNEQVGEQVQQGGVAREETA